MMSVRSEQMTASSLKIFAAVAVAFASAVLYLKIFIQYPHPINNAVNLVLKKSASFMMQSLKGAYHVDKSRESRLPWGDGLLEGSIDTTKSVAAFDLFHEFSAQPTSVIASLVAQEVVDIHRFTDGDIRSTRGPVSHFLGNISGARLPFVFPVADWQALTWNLQSLAASSWTILENVLCLPRENSVGRDQVMSNIPPPVTFLFRSGNELLTDVNHISFSAAKSDDISKRYNGRSHPGHYRKLRRYKEDLWGQVPKTISSMHFLDFLTATRGSSGTTVGTNDIPDSNADTTVDLHQHNCIYSTDYRVMELMAKLQNHTKWRELRIWDSFSDEFSEKLKSTAKMPVPNLLVSQAGGAMQARYSEYHKVRVQLHGKSKYVLFPPEDAPTLRLFPSVHHCAHQSQIDLYHSIEFSSSSHHFNVAPLHAYSILLEPGEALFIPPYWFALTESVSTAVVLDIPSPSMEQHVLAPAVYQQLPFNAAVLTQPELILATQVFIFHLLSRIEGVRSIRHYGASLYRTRYALLYPEQGIHLQKNATFNCFRDQYSLQKSVINKLSKKRIRQSASFVAQRVKLLSMIKEETLHEILRTHYGRRGRGALRRHRQAVKWIVLADIVEQTARKAMGNAEGSLLFIRECLDKDGIFKIEENVDDREHEIPGPATLHFEDMNS